MEKRTKFKIVAGVVAFVSSIALAGCASDVSPGKYRLSRDESREFVSKDYDYTETGCVKLGGSLKKWSDDTLHFERVVIPHSERVEGPLNFREEIRSDVLGNTKWSLHDTVVRCDIRIVRMKGETILGYDDFKSVPFLETWECPNQ